MNEESLKQTLSFEEKQGMLKRVSTTILLKVIRSRMAEGILPFSKPLDREIVRYLKSLKKSK